MGEGAGPRLYCVYGDLDAVDVGADSPRSEKWDGRVRTLWTVG